MNCYSCRRKLIQYIEGALDDRASRCLEEHISRCGKCASELQSLRSISTALRSVGEPAIEPAHDLWAKVSARIANEPVPSAPSRAWLPRTAAAALLAVVVIIGGRSFFYQNGAFRPKESRQQAAKLSSAPVVSKSVNANGQKVNVIAETPPSSSPKKILPKRPVLVAQIPKEMVPKVVGDGELSGGNVRKEGEAALRKMRPISEPLKADSIAEAPLQEAAVPCCGNSELALQTAKAQMFYNQNESAGSAAKLALPVPDQNMPDIVRDSGNKSVADYCREFDNGNESTWPLTAASASRSGVMKELLSHYQDMLSADSGTRSCLILFELQSVSNDCAGMLITARKLTELKPNISAYQLKLAEANERCGNRRAALDIYTRVEKGKDAEAAAIAQKRIAELNRPSK